jgi:two-component system OmpR family response regulator
MANILVIEDEPRTARAMVEELAGAGYRMEWSPGGKSGLAAALDGAFDLITLDRLLPDMDGLELLGEMRRRGIDVPVLVVSALDAVDERVRGLRSGGDDYLTKPFALVELTARVEALLRRRGTIEPRSTLAVGDLMLDLIAREASRAGRPIELTARQFRLLEFLVRQAGSLVTRTMLFEAVWDYKFDPGTNLIDVHIGRLRRKLDLPEETPMIRTVRGAGWVLDAPR